MTCNIALTDKAAEARTFTQAIQFTPSDIVLAHIKTITALNRLIIPIALSKKHPVRTEEAPKYGMAEILLEAVVSFR